MSYCKCFSLPVREYLHLCNTEQQLYDIANFIRFHKNGEYSESKWIVVGEFQGGKLAAWSRLKFPSLVEGAVAVNAPLKPQKEFKEFFEDVSEKLSELGVLKTITAAYDIIAKDIQQNKLDSLKDTLGLCSSPANSDIEVQKKNIQYMKWSITWNLEAITRLEDTEANNYKTAVLEKLAVDSTTDPVKKLSDALKIIRSRNYGKCTHVDYLEAVEFIKSGEKSDEYINRQFITLISGLGSREAFWQSCIQFGYMKTSTENMIFGEIPLSFYTAFCEDVFKSWYEEYNENILDRSINTINMFYNEKNIDVGHILFINNEGDINNIFANTDYDANEGIIIIDVPEDIPDDFDQLSMEMSDNLRRNYENIFDYIRILADVDELALPKVTAPKSSNIKLHIVDREDEIRNEILRSRLKKNREEDDDSHKIEINVRESFEESEES